MRWGGRGRSRTFHSLRHTFAGIALENVPPIYWLSKHLGHSSIEITDRVYGHIDRDAKQREAAALAGVFGV